MPQRSVVEAPNPLREGLRIKQSVEPCVMVIFGATGDLTHRTPIPVKSRLISRYGTASPLESAIFNQTFMNQKAMKGLITCSMLSIMSVERVAIASFTFQLHPASILKSFSVLALRA